MHTNSKEDIADKLGFANEFFDFRDLKTVNPWFGVEHRTLRQLTVIQFTFDSYSQ